MTDDYDTSKVHIYLDKTTDAFNDFKKLLKKGGLIISFKTPAQLKKDYDIDLEAEKDKLSYIQFADDPHDNQIPAKPEYVINKSEKTYESKQPFLLQGIELMTHANTITSIKTLIYMLSERSAKYNTPALIPLNKRFYIEEGLEKYLAEYVVKHDGD